LKAILNLPSKRTAKQYLKLITNNWFSKSLNRRATYLFPCKHMYFFLQHTDLIYIYINLFVVIYRCDLLSIMTEVNRCVAKRSVVDDDVKYKQLPLPYTTLTKKVYFLWYDLWILSLCVHVLCVKRMADFLCSLQNQLYIQMYKHTHTHLYFI